MECTLPNPVTRLDHRQHMAVGGLAGVSALAGLLAFDPEAELPARIVFPIAAALLVGAVKEIADDRDQANHCADWGDLAATGFGGAAIVAINLSWSF